MPDTGTRPPRRSPGTEVDVSDAELGRLRRLNLTFGLVHLVSGVVMLLIANDFAPPVTSTFLDDAPGNGVDPSRLTTHFDVPLAYGTAGFLLLSALFHLLIVSPVGFPAYGSEIRHHRNRFRWVEYSLSSSLMIMLIAMLVGISDIVALVTIAGVNASMILFGWLMEVANGVDRRTDGESVWWTPFWFGCIAGVVPWVAVGIYLFGPGSDVPNFVYIIFFTIFVFFNIFALNQYLQYRRTGRWADYVFGERVYVWLSITAKSALAWQIFGNTLAG